MPLPYDDRCFDRNETNKIIAEMSHLINFFSVSFEQQLLLLPKLPAQRSYDFHNGDLTTDKSLLWRGDTEARIQQSQDS